MAWPYWLFSSIFNILDEDLLSCFFPLIVTSISTFSVSGSFTSMSVSKASLAFTQLKPPIRVFSKTLIKSASFGKAIQHLLLLQCTNPEKLLALLHFFRIEKSVLVNLIFVQIFCRELLCLGDYIVYSAPLDLIILREYWIF